MGVVEAYVKWGRRNPFKAALLGVLWVAVMIMSFLTSFALRMEARAKQQTIRTQMSRTFLGDIFQPGQTMTGR